MRCILFPLLIFYMIEKGSSGMLDWFKSKPEWIKKIDYEPLVEVFNPRGMRISISDVDGMTLFSFNGNVNILVNQESLPKLQRNVTEPTNGRWVYYDTDIELKEFDVIHYYIIVKVNNEEYKFPRSYKVINNLIPLATHLETPFYTVTRDPNIPVFQYGFPTGKPLEICPCNKSIDDFEMNMENLACKHQVDSISDLIIDFMKNNVTNSKLILTGGPAPDQAIMATNIIRRFLIGELELFDLEVKIKNAEYTNCGVLFEMMSIVDKLRIVYQAETDLKNSRYKFIEPGDQNCNTIKFDKNDKIETTTPFTYVRV